MQIKAKPVPVILGSEYLGAGRDLSRTYVAFNKKVRRSSCGPCGKMPVAVHSCHRNCPNKRKRCGNSLLDTAWTSGSKLLIWRLSLRLEQADVVDEAAPAFGPPRFAHIAAVQDEPMMGVVLVALWYDAIQLELDL